MKKILIKLISFYKRFVSVVLVLLFGKGCRFTPTCSDYAKASIDKHGVLRGTLLTVKRLSKCHPFGSSGYDPVP